MLSTSKFRPLLVAFFLAGMWIGGPVGTSHAEERRGSIPDGIFKYVERPEPDFAWKSVETTKTPLGTVHRLELTSQKWHGIVWKHAMLVYDPPKVAHPEHALLFVTGGRTGRIPGEKDFALGLKLANLCQARVVTLHQVPNQPLLGDHVEDDLITETWLKYLDTGDETWPLLFPMVKSAVKAMDAVEEFAQKEWKVKLKGYVITGASKRGWTSWLTPVVDQRVLATAPIVIDVLNFQKQMEHQKQTWGYYSEQIEDYTSKGLVKLPGEAETPREVLLREMMDPYTYRDRLKLPKLMIVGTNDRYWVVDAMDQYWNGLVGPKYVLQVPNAGHGLGQGKADALKTLAAFFQHIATGKRFPEMTWTFSKETGGIKVDIQSTPAPLAVRLWSAKAPQKDFRESKWSSEELPGEGSERTGRVSLPKEGHVALFGELQFREFDIPFSLSTLVFVE